jgi:EAL domain-containing protein (putative c-di-GMP-specific phosphodiesterase class I)
MYRAKEKGKNRYHFYSSRLDDKVRRHFMIEKALRYALENEGFYLVFQPQIDLSSEVVVGLEALLRIDEKIAGPLDPNEFIPVAEESDLILKIGRWVFTRCCQIFYRWRGQYAVDSLQISINLSRRQLMDDSWVDFVRQQLERYEIDPTRIEFEITETAFMQSERTGYRNIRRLQELGCKISIDDFGTGYSSLATLKEFTVDKLKIDKSFIDDIARNATDRTIVKASIAMAHAMGLTTIAEGVESDDQKRVIKLMGCKEMQGFLYSKPKRPAEILKFLEKMNKQKK